MSDLWIIVSAANASKVSAFLTQFDRMLGYPCCACATSQSPSCTCAKHTNPAGSATSHVGSRTLRHTESITNSVDGRLAIRVDPVIAWLRLHPEIVSKYLTPTQQTVLYAAIDGATTLDSTWLPTSPT